MQLSVIIVNFNVQYFLEQALLSVRKASVGLRAEIFVVDNNSADGSVAMVRERFPEVQLIDNEDNVGFSVANNQAIRLATGKYILLLNPDTVVQEDTFHKCLDFMESHPEAGGLGVRMMDGAGKFLPESKRGFPSPFVAFCKAFGLSRLFPTSRTFNRYHLGFLGEHDTNEIDVLAGAFMLLRRAALDEVGLLDEAFFMYGEDIDLSYRIVQGGWKNYYFPATSIIHYKGESTKKGSLNYVKTFYQAMIIFAKKHFHGSQAHFFVAILRFAIYFRAALTLVGNYVRKSYVPILDAAIIYCGMFFIKNYWAAQHYHNPDYYPTTFLYINMPLYIIIWLSGIYFNGGYDEKYNLQRLVRGLFVGTVLIAAVYGFLSTEYRTSRMLIIFSALWAVLSVIALRFIFHYFQYKSWQISNIGKKNLVVIGSPKEAERVQKLMFDAQIRQNFIGIIAPEAQNELKNPQIGHLSHLEQLVQLYRINEIIFCSQDISSQEIMAWMTRLGAAIEYKIVPQESLSIIGSHSRNSSGELYTIEIKFCIAEPLHRRNKRLLDVCVALCCVLFLPVLIFSVSDKKNFIKNIWAVLRSQKTWVGYAPPAPNNLPPLKSGVLSPIHVLKTNILDEKVVQRVNFLYAKDYSAARDFDLIWKAWKNL